jgi:heptosyltransferase-2
MNQKILVVKTGALGDLIVASAAFQSIAQAFPDSKLYILTHPAYHEVVRYCPLFNKIFFLGRNLPSDIFRALLLRKERFDFIVDLQGNLRTNFLCFLAGGKRRVGFCKKGVGRHFLHEGMLPVQGENPVDGLLVALRLIGIKHPTRNTALWLPPDRESLFRDIAAHLGLETPGQIVVLHPFSSRRWTTKRGTPEQWAYLSDLLAEKGYFPAFIGRDEDGWFARIRALCRKTPISFVNNLNIHQTGAFLKHAVALITTDSAPMHMGCAAGIKTIALFGPTDPKRHCPSGAIAVWHDVGCNPCYRTHCQTLKCMKMITPEEILEHIEHVRT